MRKKYIYNEEHWLDKVASFNIGNNDWQAVDRAWDILSRKRSLANIVIEINEDHYTIMCNDKLSNLEDLEYDLQDVVIEALKAYITGEKLPDYMIEV